MPISCLYLACLYLNAVFLAIMASVVKLFTLLCSSEILINKTLSNCNTIAELMRLAFVAKKTQLHLHPKSTRQNFSLLDAIFDCFKQIRTSSRIYFQHWRVFWSFTVDSVGSTSKASVKKKPFQAAVNITCERNKFTPLWNFKAAWISLRGRVNTLLVFVCVLFFFVKFSIWLTFFNFNH